MQKHQHFIEPKGGGLIRAIRRGAIHQAFGPHAKRIAGTDIRAHLSRSSIEKRHTPI